MATHIVDVHGKSCEVLTTQRSKAVWVAVGRYLGRRFEEQGRTESAAVHRWREAARYHGNDPPPDVHGSDRDDRG